MSLESRRRRLLIYADSAIFSGAEAFLVDLARDLRETSDIELEAAVPFDNTLLFERMGEAIGGQPTYDVPSQPLRLAGLHLPWMAKRIGRRLAGCEVDFVLLNLPSPEYGAALLLSDVLPGVPKVGLLHIAVSMKEMGFKLGWARDRLATRALRRLDGACLLSNRAEALFRDRLGSQRTETAVIRMPKPSVRTVPTGDARARLGLPPGKRLVGMAGRITLKQKGQDTFVEAATELAARDSEVDFVVVGDGPDRSQLAGMVDRAGLGERFHLLGHVDEIGLFLSAIDLIAIPSRFEGLPLIALEALQVGVPGIASAVDGLLDVWPREWTIPASKPDLLANSLEVILDETPSGFAEMIKEGRALAHERETMHPGEDVAAVLRRTAMGAAKC